MTEIYIKYNPYTVETEFKINNEPIRKNSTFAAQSKKRLQYWLERNDNNWDGIVAELKKATNDTDFNITFEGRKVDFEDLEIIVNQNNQDSKIVLIHIETKNDKDILKNIDELIDVFNNGPINELKSEEVKKAYEEVKSSKFEVSVLATMSSGKSTLINSLIGDELLPSENQACTATIARITDNDDIKEFIVECKDENGNIIHEKKVATLSDLQSYNKDENVTYIDLEGPIPNISSENLNLLIVDTPGPNNSRNKDHEEVTKSIINDKNKGIVLYVMNATQFATNDDKDLLEMIAKAMKRGGKQSKDRFIFAINKCDEFDCEKESIKDLLSSVKEYLCKYGIKEPNLFPVSAQTAKLIRMYQKDIELTRKEKKDLAIYEDFIEVPGYHFDKMASLSESCRRNLDIKLGKFKEDHNEYEEALIHTGIPAIEETINEYLIKYAYPIKINDAIIDFKKIIGQMSQEMDLDKKIADNNKEYEKIRVQIENASEKKRKGQEASRLKKRIENFGIDDSKFKSIEKEIFNVFNNISRKYNNIKEIEESFAKIEIGKFKNEIMTLQKTLENNLNAAIEDSVISQGKKLVDEYKQYLKTLNADLSIDGFSFEKIRSIQKININDVDDLVEKYERTEEIYREKRNENTDKKWYKPWTWNEPDFYTSREKTGEKKLVNVVKLIEESMAAIQNQVDKNINSSKEEGNEKVTKLKKYFENELDKFDKLMENIIDDLNKKTENRYEIIARAKENQGKKIWIDDVIKDIDNIMSI